MTELQLSRRLAQIVVYGHIGLFVFGLIIFLVGRLEGIDTAQIILMGSPLLAIVALAGFRHVVNANVKDTTPPANPVQAQMTQVVCIIFIGALAVIYGTTLFQSTTTADVLKLLVGATETALGAYLGIIKDRFFVLGQQT